MTNVELIARIENGPATVGYRREYARRVGRTPEAAFCRRGHLACALAVDGPCAQEVYQPVSIPNPFADRLVALVELKVAVEIAADTASTAGEAEQELRLREMAADLETTMARVERVLLAAESGRATRRGQLCTRYIVGEGRHYVRNACPHAPFVPCSPETTSCHASRSPAPQRPGTGFPGREPDALPATV